MSKKVSISLDSSRGKVGSFYGVTLSRDNFGAFGKAHLNHYHTTLRVDVTKASTAVSCV